MSPFDYINNISSSTESIWAGDISEKEYPGYMINRGLSQYRDTVLFAQEMNMKGPYISNRMQYDFYLLGISHKKKRFAKWHKPDKLEKIERLAAHHGINIRMMEQYASLMSESDFDSLLAQLETGGRNAK